MYSNNVEDFFITLDTTIHEAIACIDRSGRISIALIVDDEHHLVGTITDGDIRRCILAGIGLDAPVRALMPIKADSDHPCPVTAPQGTPQDVLLHILQSNSVRQLPLLDDDGRVVDIVTLQELLPEELLNFQAVIMAGGQGTRLKPLTDAMPKPMLPVGDKPLMEYIVNQLNHAGIRRLFVTTHYLSEKIREYFGDGTDFGMQISYVDEDRPLGTAGSLGLINCGTEPLLVINGDILTRLDFQSMLLYHLKHQSDLTVVVRQYEQQVPFGVVECNGALIRGICEKPVYKHLVNTGIYLIEPPMLGYIPKGKRFDMTELIEVLICAGRRVISFPIVEYWLDIGRAIDYEHAQQEIKTDRWNCL